MPTTIEAIRDALTRAEKIKQVERDKCKQDVCPYCSGMALQYKRSVEGPNSAGNYTHSHKEEGFNPVLCKASSIFAREKWDQSGLQAFTEQTITP